MLLKRVAKASRLICRTYTSARRFEPVQVLPDAEIKTFCKHAFEPRMPALLPQRTFVDLPAVDRWFIKARNEDYALLSTDYLAQYSGAQVPLEFSNEDGFERVEQPLSVFLEASAPVNPIDHVYLAQAPIPDLPQGLRDDIPAPDLVLQADKGDVYDSSIWLGTAPTYTPLHRDPNPNLFVQLAGKKIVRLFKPDVGQGIFARVQEKVGGRASATMRGEEMMQGAEKRVLEEEVWVDESEGTATGFEAELGSGDGLFIPKGWWHSVKGVGKGMTGSVNWWFR